MLNRYYLLGRLPASLSQQIERKYGAHEYIFRISVCGSRGSGALVSLFSKRRSDRGDG